MRRGTATTAMNKAFTRAAKLAVNADLRIQTSRKYFRSDQLRNLDREGWAG